MPPPSMARKNSGSGRSGVIPSIVPAMTFLGLDAAAWSALGAWASALILAATLIPAVLQLRANDRLRRSKHRPYVTAAIVAATNGQMLMFHFKNVGRTMALNTCVAFEPMPRSDVIEMDQVALFKQPIPSTAPGHEHFVYWGLGHKVLGEDYEYPQVFDVSLTYEDVNGHVYGPERYTLDGKSLARQAAIRSDLYNVSEQLEKIASAIDGGLAVEITDSDRKRRRRDRPNDIEIAKSAREDDGWIAALRALMRR